MGDIVAPVIDLDQKAKMRRWLPQYPNFVFSEQKLKMLPPGHVYAMFCADSHPARNAETYLNPGLFKGD